MSLPELTFKIWEGDGNEYFRWIDWNRLTYNANIMAREAEVQQVQFIEVTRADQFRYDEAQKLEDLTADIAEAVGVTVTIEEHWGHSRTLSYVDFERMESNLYQCYQAMGGVGDRIDSEKFRIIVNATLYADDWSSSSPCYQDIDLPFYHGDADAMAWVSHLATDQQRYYEREARLTSRVITDRRIRVWALGRRPRVDIPIRIKRGILDMNASVTMRSNAWQGEGPYTQTVTIPTAATDAVIGVWEGMSDNEVNQFVEAMIAPSAINGTSVTLRALGTKPTIDITAKLMWNELEEI